MLRTRQRYYELGDKGHKLFFFFLSEGYSRPTNNQRKALSALTCLQSGKSQGLDGYTVDFYQKFQQHLIGPPMEMYQYIIDKRVLPPTLREVLISLICKPEKNPTLPSSYSPVSLPNDLRLCKGYCP